MQQKKELKVLKINNIHHVNTLNTAGFFSEISLFYSEETIEINFNEVLQWSSSDVIDFEEN